MNSLHYWILSAVIVLTVGACAGGPDEVQAAIDTDLAVQDLAKASHASNGDN